MLSGFAAYRSSTPNSSKPSSLSRTRFADVKFKSRSSFVLFLQKFPLPPRSVGRGKVPDLYPETCGAPFPAPRPYRCSPGPRPIPHTPGPLLASFRNPCLINPGGTPARPIAPGRPGGRAQAEADFQEHRDPKGRRSRPPSPPAPRGKSGSGWGTGLYWEAGAPTQ